MNKTYLKWVCMCLLLPVLFFFSGCAVNRGIVDIPIDTLVNPNRGTVVAISKVRDIRVFELKPAQPSIPSLKNGEIDDSSITSRAIARKRNGYGKALGDILLPEGTTVSQVVQKILVKSLIESGYIVVTENDDDYSKAIQLNADVEQFWAYVDVGFWALTLHFDAKVKLSGDIGPLSDTPVIVVAEKQSCQMADTRAWESIFNRGVEALELKTQKQLIVSQ